MQVTILAGMAGEPFAPGEVVDLSADRAKQLVSEGRAELVQMATTRDIDRLEVTDDRVKARRRPAPKE